VILFGDAGIDLRELVRVPRAIIGWDPDSQQQYPRAGRLDQLHHFHQIFFRVCNRQPPQSVISTKLQNYEARMMLLQGTWQALQATASGLSAHAGIDDLVPVTLGLQSLREQRNPTLLRPKLICGAQTVAHHEDRAVGRHRVLERDE